VTRRPNIRSASVDLAFLLAALIAGWAGATLAVAGLVFAGAAAAWWGTRRAALAAMAPRRRITQSALALLMLAGVLALFYGLGLMLGGHT